MPLAVADPLAPYGGAGWLTDTVFTLIYEQGNKTRSTTDRVSY